MSQVLNKFYCLLPEECEDMLADRSLLFFKTRDLPHQTLRELTDILGMKPHFLVSIGNPGRWAATETFVYYKIIQVRYNLSDVVP